MLRGDLTMAGIHPEELHEAEVVVVHVLGGEADGREQQEAPVVAGEHNRGRATQRTCRAQGSRIGVLRGASGGLDRGVEVKPQSRASAKA